MERKTIDELKSICRENNYKGFSTYTKKKDLLEFIQSRHTSSVSDVITHQTLDPTLIPPPTTTLIPPPPTSPITPPTDIILPIVEKTLTEIQDEEYEIALQKDLERQKQEAYKAEIDKLYSEKLSNTELDKVRLARLNRFG